MNNDWEGGTTYNNYSDGTIDVDSSDEEEFTAPLRDPGQPVLRRSVRKLKHVVGVTLRNLTLISPEIYAKRRASLVKWQQNSFSLGSSPIEPVEGDDEADLQYQKNHKSGDLDHNNNNNNPTSPRKATRRRASTLTQPGQSLGVGIEQTLQDLNQDQLLDSMFALYSSRQSPPVYISEMAHRSMNPEFREIDFGELYCRNEKTMTVAVYAKTCSGSKWTCLFKHQIQLDSLVFVGKSIDVVRLGFPRNTLITHLEDGCYVLPGVASEITGNRFGSSMSALTCGFDMIMKLNNLEECIRDSTATSNNVGQQLQSLLDSDSMFVQKKHRDQLQNKLKHTRQFVATERTKTKQAQHQVADLKLRLANRRKVMEEQTMQKQNLQSGMKQLNAAVLQVQEQLIAGEQGRIALQLQDIFPIALVPNKSLEFSICGLEMPDLMHTTLNAENEEQVGAAYGFASQLMHLLSEYLEMPLRYPIQPYGSNSFIIDPISTIQGSRTFPLWITGSLFYRFEYGVYLFHKDLEQLINSQNVAVADLSQTLANLKNLLLVLSSSG